MSKNVMISINKPHTDNIFSGDKSLEWRKKPLPIGRHYVYETKNKGGCGMVIGEMIITGSKEVDTSRPLEVCLVNAGRIHPATLKQYANNGIVYANFIKDAKRYDEPKPLSVFRVPCKEHQKDYPQCGNCDYYHSMGEYPAECGSDGAKPLIRPPQSWCYVEEVHK